MSIKKMRTSRIINLILICFLFFLLPVGCSTNQKKQEEKQNQIAQKQETPEQRKREKADERKHKAETVEKKQGKNREDDLGEEPEPNPLVPDAEKPKEKNTDSIKIPDFNQLLEPIISQSNQLAAQSDKKGNQEVLDSIWIGVDDVAAAAQSYYSEFFSKTRLISKNGYLYNKAADTLIDVNYLCDSELLDSQYRNGDYEILLLYGSDVARYSKLSIKESDRDFAVFVAYHYDKSGQYFIASSKSTGGILEAQEYQELLRGYCQDHGSVNRLLPNTTEYDRILTFIKMYESKFDQYYVRSILMDGKYAFVTLSPQISTADVKQYILMKENGLWEVVMDKLESEPRLIVAVNKKIPDFNISLLPKYSLYDYKNRMKTGFTDIITLMIEEELIEKPDEISYLAGTDQYCYGTTTAGEKYLFQQKGEQWSIFGVSSGDEAERRMAEQNKDAPVFIVLDD